MYHRRIIILNYVTRDLWLQVTPKGHWPEATIPSVKFPLLQSSPPIYPPLCPLLSLFIKIDKANITHIHLRACVCVCHDSRSCSCTTRVNPIVSLCSMQPVPQGLWFFCALAQRRSDIIGDIMFRKGAKAGLQNPRFRKFLGFLGFRF